MKTYLFDIRPVPKPRMTQADKWQERKPVMDYWAFKDELNLKANLQRFRIGDKLQIEFTFKTTKETLWGKPHKEKPDLDNLVKAFMDALAVEDKDIYKLIAVKWWGMKDSIKVLE